MLVPAMATLSSSKTRYALAGVTAIVHPGGSVKDADSIALADARGAAMVLTGVRHFRH